MKKILNFLMLSCKKASMLIEKKLLVKLSHKEKFQLTLHKSMCNACTNYEKQSIAIDKMLHKHFRENEAGNEIKNKTLKERIISKL